MIKQVITKTIGLIKNLVEKLERGTYQVVEGEGEEEY
jgi:hypothetical protein